MHFSSHTSGSSSELVERNAAYTSPRPDIFEMVPKTARMILDVGCSNGALGRCLKLDQPDRMVAGIEYDTTFANEAALYLDHVVNADLNIFNWRQTYADRNFDCIIFADVLEHLVDPQRCLQHALEHLKPGGCLVVSLPNIRHISALRAVWLGGRFPQRDRGIFDRTHLRWFTVTDAHSLLTDSGLKVSSINLALRWGDHAGGRLNHLLNRLPRAIKEWAPVREFLTYQVCLRASNS